MMTKPISIYIHIPFCLSKCRYCAFYSEKYNEKSANEYINSLKDLLKFFSKKAENATVQTIYFGGGTPTSINSQLLCGLLEHIKKYYNLSSDCEITVEANPKTVNIDDAFSLYQSGFNRVSMGIQSSNNKRLEDIGRIHSWEDAVESYGILKKAGFSNISVDLMFGLPNTKTEDVSEDIMKILSLNPNHISAYALSLEEGTPLFNQRRKYVFPDEDMQFDMYMNICSILNQKGYSHYEISNFAIDGYLSKHNSGYWSRRDYIGFGSGAHSLWENKRFFSISNKDIFIEKVKNKEFLSALGFDRFDEISEEEKREEEIMLSLRTSKGIFLDSLPKSFNKFIDNEFATYSNSIFSLTDKGFFVSNSIIYHVCKELLYDKQ